MDDREYELKRRDLIRLLQTYKDERHNIDRLTKIAQTESEEDFYPSSVDYSKDKVQSSFDSGEMGERMILKVEKSRKHLAEAMYELNDKIHTLDKLFLEITKLPAHQGRVIIGLYLDGHSESKIAETMDKSEETISGYRKAAIKRLTRTVMGEKIRTWRGADVK